MLTPAKVERALTELQAGDDTLAAVLDRLGPPPVWRREPGFAGLVHIILEQQVSLASARACYDKLCARAGELSPGALLKLTDDELRAAGLSRQKSRYCRELARAVVDGSLSLARLPELDDQTVRKQLMAVTGIGLWTADIYLLMALGRMDVWPVGDLALAIAVRELYQLDSRPSAEQLLLFGERWRPHRAMAARVLWHYYLNR